MANRSLYVGNLAPTVTEGSLKAAFASYRPTAARIVKNRGFGYVEMDEDQVPRAMHGMNGRPLDGRALTVTEASPVTVAGIHRNEGARRP